jgi:TolA-binding protein
MTCDEVRERGLAGDYVAGLIEPNEMDAFEEHYFGCDACFAEVKALRDAQKVLAKRQPRQARPWIYLAAMAAGITAIGIYVSVDRTLPPQPQQQQAKAPQAPDLTLLAKFEPPPYQEVLHRGAESSAFQEAMKHYQTGDYTAAIRLLRGETAPKARFYLGASQLVAGELEQGTATLEPLATDKANPYQEESLYLLANAALARNDGDGAKARLDTLIALGGDWAGRAGQLKAKIR